MFCSNCGTALKPNETFCPKCGKQIAEKEPTSPEIRENVPSESEKRIKKRIRLVFLALVLLVTGFLVYRFVEQQAPVRVIKSQLAAIQSQKLDEAYGYTSKTFQKQMGVEQFRHFLEEHPVLLYGKSLKVEGSAIGDVDSIVHGKFEAMDEEVPVIYRLDKEQGEWKIGAIEISKSTRQKNEENKEAISKEESVVQKLIPNPAPSDEAQAMNVVEDLLKLVRSGEIEKAYKDYLSKEFHIEMPYEKFTEFLSKYKELRDNEALEIGSVKIEKDQAIIQTFLSFKGKEEKIPLEVRLVKEDGDWRVWSLRLTLPLESLGEHPDFSKMLATIELQIKALKEGLIKTAYEEYTSKRFRDVTSLTEFEEFVRKFPALTQYQTIEFKERSVQNDSGKVFALFKDQHGVTEVEFLLGLENNVWKIWTIEVIKSPTVQQKKEETETFDASPLKKVIEEQLATLGQQKVETAYTNYGSRGFKEATSFPEFEDFIKHFPVFMRYTSFQFGKLVFNNNIAMLPVILTDLNGMKFQVEYHLVQEGSDWKILQIKTLPKGAI